MEPAIISFVRNEVKKLFENNVFEVFEGMTLTEGMTDIVYHFTRIHSLLNIFKTNQLYASTNMGSSADLTGNKNKFFFFSTTRNKSTGYNLGDVKIVLNGQKLSQKYKSFPTDYWQYSTKPSDWGDVENDPKAKQAYFQSLRTKETEDRIALDKPTIDNASNYIMAVHINLRKNRELKNEIEQLIEYGKQYNIPLYFYDNEKNYLLQINNIDPFSFNGYSEPEQDEKHDFMSDYKFMFDVLALLAYKDEANREKILKTFNPDNNEDFVKALDNQIERASYHYLSYPNKFGMNEYNSVIGASIHNARSRMTDNNKKTFLMLANDFKKWKANNLAEYIGFKCGWLKPKSDVEKTTYKLYDVGGYRPIELSWTKNAWHYLDRDIIWNSLSERQQNDIKFTAFINKEDATFEYAYNFLMKTLSKKTANEIFNKSQLEIRKEEY